MRRGKKHNSATAQETGPALSVELLALRLLLVQDMKEMVETTIGNALESFKKSLELLEASTGGHRKCLTELETGLNSYSDKIVTLEGLCERLAPENKTLLSQAVEAEDRTRRFNLRYQH